MGVNSSTLPASIQTFPLGISAMESLPTAIIHHFPGLELPFHDRLKEIVNPIDPSDPSYPTLAPSARLMVVVGPSPLTSQHLAQYPALECVIGTSAGVNHIDLAECRRRSIRVTRAGGGSFAEDVADWAVGLLLDVLRRISASDKYVRGGQWALKGDYPLGSKLGGKRVGIVGLGNIGLMIAKRLEPFGCTIAYNSRSSKPDVPFTFYSSVVELATDMDHLIVCCTLTDETNKIINKDVMTALGKKGVIVNVGRGALVEEEELVKFLVGGELGGAGLDVFANEPNVPKELIEMDNVVLTPHKAAITTESFEALRVLVMGNIEAFFSDKPLKSQYKLDD